MPLIANLEQAAAWDGPEGDHWTEHAEHYERTTCRHRDWLLRAELLSPDDDVLDVGCGTGALTRAAARRALGGSALGVDLSRRMIERARDLATAERITNAWFEQADAEVHAFAPANVDAVISSFGATFFGDPLRAFANLANTLRPGGRLGLLVWRELARNEWVSAIRDALAAGRSLPVPPPGVPGPFALADTNHVRDLLDRSGLVNIDLQPVDEVMDFGVDAEQAFAFISEMGIVQGLTEDLDADTKAEAFDKLRASLAASETVDGVLFDSSAWLITAQRP
jgi:SAM-dependent methyltransferase